MTSTKTLITDEEALALKRQGQQILLQMGAQGVVDLQMRGWALNQIRLAETVLVLREVARRVNADVSAGPEKENSNSDESELE